MKKPRESTRKLLHIAFGAFLILSLNLLSAYFGEENARSAVASFLSLGLLAGLFFIDRKIKLMKTPVIDFMIDLLERPNHPPGHGAFWYGVGAVSLVAFLPGVQQASIGLFILSFSDGLSSIVGARGSHRLPYNNQKTLEGLVTFFAFSLMACIPLGARGVALALFSSLVESLNLHLDDNFTVPLSVIIFFKAFGG